VKKFFDGKGMDDERDLSLIFGRWDKDGDGLVKFDDFVEDLGVC
jgi:Ca2+-binding EF-hand superfamily protein